MGGGCIPLIAGENGSQFHHPIVYTGLEGHISTGVSIIGIELQDHNYNSMTTSADNITVGASPRPLYV